MWPLSPAVPTLEGRGMRGLWSAQGPGRQGTKRGGSCVSGGDGRRLRGLSGALMTRQKWI